MNETLRLMAGRRSVAPHLLQGPGPSAEELSTLLKIAARVPDHGRLVPWRFLVIEGEAQERVGAAIAAAFLADNPGADESQIAVERRRLARAPLVVGVVCRAKPHVKIPDWEQLMSAGAVTMNLVVAANAMGFSTAWLTEWYAYDRRILARLGLEPEERIAGLVHIGRSAETPADRERPDLEAIVTRL